MQLLITGKNIKVGDSLHTYIESNINSISEKFFVNPIEATIIVSKESTHFRTDVSVHVGKGLIVRCHAMNDDPYSCFDAAVHKLEERLRRHKNRLRDHHQAEDQPSVDGEGHNAQVYVMNAAEATEEETAAGEPTVIAEMTTKVPILSVSEAVMHLDLSDQTLLFFKNPHGDLNAVFRRPDGNVGWIDPTLKARAS